MEPAPNQASPNTSERSNQPVSVHKLDLEGQETWQYQGILIERSAHHVLLEAFFDRDDTPLHGMTLRRGDRFLETYYDDRWYNIFEIHAGEDDRLKGWYCNIGFPAEFKGYDVSYRDLALDLLVFPDGRQCVLDEDEFALLPIEQDVQKKARLALDELKHIFSNQKLTEVPDQDEEASVDWRL
jgi:hypothetical protein